MLWIIETEPAIAHDGTMELSDPYRTDVGFLEGNPSIRGHLTRRDVTFPKAATTPTGGLVAGEPIYVLAHAGFHKSGEPWIGGMSFKAFAEEMVTKFGAQLKKRTVYALVCFIGSQAHRLAEALAEAGAENVTVYVPDKLMYVSTAGIPHVLQPDWAFEVGNKKVQAHQSRHKGFNESLPCGKGWSGANGAAGTATVIPPKDVENAVIGHFDPARAESEKAVSGKK
ncbi:hypothetical protein [Nonomuraea sp. NPDC050643]|uniref:hypothetical protein n=1 Tax=Nonomuraea sp. NPDC050643 TaxID=3155660 RepID=UPI0033CBD0C3